MKYPLTNLHHTCYNYLHCMNRCRVCVCVCVRVRACVGVGAVCVCACVCPVFNAHLSCLSVSVFVYKDCMMHMHPVHVPIHVRRWELLYR